MDILPEVFNNWLLNYGVIVLFFLLALGIIALPVPEETLLVFSGVLASQQTFSLFPTFLAAVLGSMFGITVSYSIGLAGGIYLIKKYGSYIGLNDEKMKKIHDWFENYGRWVLFVGYFIPGVRHFTGLFAGVSGMEYRHFALFAYLGAFFWVSLFLFIGYFFGSYYQVAFELVERNIEIVLTAGVLVLIITLIIYMHNSSKND